MQNEVSTNVFAQCLNNPTDAPTIVKSTRQEILMSDVEALLSLLSFHYAKYEVIGPWLSKVMHERIQSVRSYCLYRVTLFYFILSLRLKPVSISGEVLTVPRSD